MQVHSSAYKPSAIIEHRLRPLFFHELSSLNTAIKELSGLHGLTVKVVSAELRSLLKDWFLHLRNQMIRLEEVSRLTLSKPGAKTDAIITAVIGKVKQIVAVKRGRGTDTIVLIEIFKLVHYKVATYHNLEQMASVLGMGESANLLHLALEEEKNWLPVLEDITSRLMQEEPIANH
jgi:ferritin-like metal-binding protein YciE